MFQPVSGDAEQPSECDRPQWGIFGYSWSSYWCSGGSRYWGAVGYAVEPEGQKLEGAMIGAGIGLVAGGTLGYFAGDYHIVGNGFKINIALCLNT